MKDQLDILLLNRRIELKASKLDEKYPARKKLVNAGYKLTGYIADEKGQKTISSIWTKTKKEDGKNVNVSLNIIDKSYTQEYEGYTKIEYSYYLEKNNAIISSGSKYMKYDFNKNEISESSGVDYNTGILYSTQAAYIKQEFEKELKRIGVSVKDLDMPES